MATSDMKIYWPDINEILSDVAGDPQAARAMLVKIAERVANNRSLYLNGRNYNQAELDALCNALRALLPA